MSVFLKFYSGIFIIIIILFSYSQEGPLLPQDYTKVNEKEVTVEESPVLNQQEKDTLNIESKKEQKQNIDNDFEQIPEEKNTSSVNVSLPLPSLLKQDFEEINKKTKKALVNVLCIPKNNTLSPISGSGVIIDPRGLILTNAHIAQYFLLPDLVDCSIRIGNPAQSTYKAKIAYISAQWLQENAENITQTNPKGTGENDYGFLFITAPKSETRVLPDRFPFIPVKTIFDPQENDSVLVAGYPAGFLGGFVIFNELYSVSSVVTVREIFTFTTETIDLFSIGGSVLAQKGSSGGAVVNEYGNVVGVIVTTTEASQTSERDLRAITVSHISHSLYEEITQDLIAFIKSDISNYVDTFYRISFPVFSEILKSELVK